MAIAPVVVPLLAACIGGIGGAILTQYFANRRDDIRWQREDDARSKERIHQRLADSYLEVLRIVERESQWVQAIIKNQEEADSLFHEVVPPEPVITDRAVIAAHLSVFSSDNVRKLYSIWRGEIDSIEEMAKVMKEYPGDARFPTSSARDEILARQALADAIAKELDHRREEGNYSWRYGEPKFPF